MCNDPAKRRRAGGIDHGAPNSAAIISWPPPLLSTGLTNLNFIDRVRSAEMIGTLLGLPFLGYAVMIAISSPMLDWIGMGRLLPLSGVLFSIGMAIMMFADGSGIGSHSGDCRADVVSLRGDSSCGSTDYLRRNLAV